MLKLLVGTTVVVLFLCVNTGECTGTGVSIDDDAN